MRRALIGLAITTLSVLALAGPASAAAAHVTQLRFNGRFAEASWSTSSATSPACAMVTVSQSPKGSELSVDQVISNLDAYGNLTGGTETIVDVTAAWTGQGTVLRGVVNQHTRDGVVRENIRFSGTSRFAPATGTVGGITFTTSDLIYGELGTTNAGTVLICIGSTCG